MCKLSVPAEKTELPEIMIHTLPSIGRVLETFHLSRDMIASNEEIEEAWKALPREISRIPSELRDGLIARMCVAVSVGLFDGAINYIWNATIVSLRLQVKNFGLGSVSQLLNKKFEEDDLNDLMDANLLKLCHQLELISEEGYYFLNQCRDIRNNFSSAHPSMAQIDDRELITFISRCCKHGISADYALQGINISDFIATVKGNELSDDTIEAWSTKLIKTFPAQRVLLIPMLHGLYCGPSTQEQVRLNALRICEAIKPLFVSKVQTALIDQHNEYRTKNETQRLKASRTFFRKLGILSLLDDIEVYSIIKSACTTLHRAHLGFDNFYNEPPLAKNLCDIVKNIEVPDSVREEYVETVITCYVGNAYGTSHAAIPYYIEMIKNLSPKGIESMLNIPRSKLLVANRIKSHANCKERYVQALDLLNEGSLTANQKTKMETLKRKLG